MPRRLPLPLPLLALSLSLLLLSLLTYLLRLPPPPDIHFPLPSPPTPTRRTALLLTAHPDDESMFFAPTLLALAAAGWETWVLCLSSGDAGGLGAVRRGELGHAAAVLGVGRERVVVVEDSRLPDSMTVPWPAEAILAHVGAFLAAHDVSLLLTFDDRGVSGHANHISLPLALLSTTLSNTSSPAQLHPPLPPTHLLLSSPLFPKYISLLSPHLPLTSSHSARYALTPAQYAHATRAMRAHRSQMLWFRWLYIGFSRYMWTNEWVVLSPPAPPTSTCPSTSAPPPTTTPPKADL